MPKTSKIEIEKRIFKIQGWIIEGAQTALILRHILEEQWCTSQRQAERLLKAARDRWIEVEEGTVEDRRRLKINELKQLKRSLKDTYKGTPGGIRAIIAVEKEIIKLEGIASPTKVELTGKDGKPLTVAAAILTPGEIKEINDVLEGEY